MHILTYTHAHAPTPSHTHKTRPTTHTQTRYSTAAVTFVPAMHICLTYLCVCIRMLLADGKRMIPPPLVFWPFQTLVNIFNYIAYENKLRDDQYIAIIH